MKPAVLHFYLNPINYKDRHYIHHKAVFFQTFVEQTPIKVPRLSSVKLHYSLL